MPASRAKQAEVRERRARALRMRSAGSSYDDIAKALNLTSAQVAANDVMRALDDRQGLLDREAARFIALEMERLETMQRSAELALRLATSNQQQSEIALFIDRLLRISQRRARLLGLDREVVGRPQPKSELDELRARREQTARNRRGRAR